MNQVILCFLFLLLLGAESAGWSGGVSYLSWYSYPLFLRALWYAGAASLNTSSLDDMVDNCLLMLSGMFFYGGWRINAFFMNI